MKDSFCSLLLCFLLPPFFLPFSRACWDPFAMSLLLHFRLLLSSSSTHSFKHDPVFAFLPPSFLPPPTFPLSLSAAAADGGRGEREKFSISLGGVVFPPLFIRRQSRRINPCANIILINLAIGTDRGEGGRGWKTRRPRFPFLREVSPSI